MVSELGVAGVMLDIAGAGWLANGLATDRSATFLGQVAGRGSSGHNYVALLDRARSVADTQTGLALLTVGFLLQLVANAGAEADWAAAMVLAFAGVALAILTHPLVRHRQEVHYVAAAFAERGVVQGMEDAFESLATNTSDPTAERVVRAINWDHRGDAPAQATAVWGPTVLSETLALNPRALEDP